MSSSFECTEIEDNADAMTEKEMEDLLWHYPQELIGQPLRPLQRQLRSAVGRADLVFEHPHGYRLLVEVKRGAAPRGVGGQLRDYFGAAKAIEPTAVYELMVIANEIAKERRLHLENLEIEAREISERKFREVAAKHDYVFASEQSLHEGEGDSPQLLQAVPHLAPDGSTAADDPNDGAVISTLGDTASGGNSRTRNLSPEAEGIMNELLAVAHRFKPGLTLKFNDGYTTLEDCGKLQNFLVFPKRKPFRLVIRVQESEQVEKDLRAAGFDPQLSDWFGYEIDLKPGEATAQAGVLITLFKKAAVEWPQWGHKMSKRPRVKRNKSEVPPS